MAGVPLLSIKEILGHEDIRMRLRYADLAPDQRVDAVKMLDDFVSKSSKTVSKGPMELASRMGHK
jgi:hypothetical protein